MKINFNKIKSKKTHMTTQKRGKSEASVWGQTKVGVFKLNSRGNNEKNKIF